MNEMLKAAAAISQASLTLHEAAERLAKATANAAAEGKPAPAKELPNLENPSATDQERILSALYSTTYLVRTLHRLSWEAPCPACGRRGSFHTSACDLVRARDALRAVGMDV